MVMNSGSKLNKNEGVLEKDKNKGKPASRSIRIYECRGNG
jgi:hypothetical protein